MPMGKSSPFGKWKADYHRQYHPYKLLRGQIFCPDKEKGHHFTRGRILLGGAAFVVGVLAGVLWPTLYHYDTASYGNKTYQVRTNRITRSMTYFDEGKWNNFPIPAANPSQAPLPVPAPPAPPPELVVKQPVPTPATKPGPAEGQKVAGKEEAPSEKQPSQPIKTKGYAIQLSAMRDRNLAREFVERQRRSGQEVHLEEIKIKDRGVWYIVYIGRFADTGEAARYMKEKKIKEIFPECFIQKLSQNPQTQGEQDGIVALQRLHLLLFSQGML